MSTYRKSCTIIGQEKRKERRAGPLHRTSVARLLPQRPLFYPRVFQARFVLDRVALRQSFLPVLHFFPVIIFRLVLHAYSFSHSHIFYLLIHHRSYIISAIEYIFKNHTNSDIRPPHEWDWNPWSQVTSGRQHDLP